MTSYTKSSLQSSKKGGNEPWRNKERHYCPLCNAWMGSDRQSISLHENGKKHREALEQDLVARREHKAKKDKNEKDLESVFAKVNAAVGISVAGSAVAASGSSFGGTRPWECPPALPGTGNGLKLQHSQGSVQQEVGGKQRAQNNAVSNNSSSSSVTGTTHPSKKLAKAVPFDPNVGHYDLEGTTYLEGQHYASILEDGMPIQLWMGGIAATASEKRDLRNFSNWKMALLAKVVTKREGKIACHVSYLQNSSDDHETLESNVHPSRIRLVLGSDPTIPSSIEEAHLALMGGEQTIELLNNNEMNSSNHTPSVAPDIDENTGLSGWSTTSIRKISSHYEQNQEKKRKREHEKELNEYKEKKEREIQARKMEEAKYANAHDSALGAYDVWSSSNSAVVAEGEGKATRSYKGVDITKEVQVEVTDTAKSLAKGKGNVAFKKKTVKKQNNVRRTLADDD